MAASAGGIQTLGRVLGGLPATFPLPIAVAQHRSPHSPNLLDRVLQRGTRLRVKTRVCRARRPASGHPGRPHARAQRRAQDRHVRSSANPLFGSAAGVLGSRVVAVVLTGGGSDATDGVQAVKTRGGMVIAQDQATSQTFGMPRGQRSRPARWTTSCRWTGSRPRCARRWATAPRRSRWPPNNADRKAVSPSLHILFTARIPL